MSATDTLLNRHPGIKRFTLGSFVLKRNRGRPPGPRSATARVWTFHANGPQSKINGMQGHSYRHPAGYVPHYGTWTDLEAFAAGERAARAGKRLRDNPYGTWKQRESWIDAYLWALATLPSRGPAVVEKRPWRGRGQAVG